MKQKKIRGFDFLIHRYGDHSEAGQKAQRSVLGQWTIRIVVAAMIVTGTYLVIENQT